MKKIDVMYKCPVCGNEVNGEYDICDKCGWENDPIQTENPDMRGGANVMSLNQAIEAYNNSGMTFFNG